MCILCCVVDARRSGWPRVKHRAVKDTGLGHGCQLGWAGSSVYGARSFFLSMIHRCKSIPSDVKSLVYVSMVSMELSGSLFWT